MILPLKASGIAFVKNSSRSSQAPSPARRFVSMSISIVKPFSSAQRRASTLFGVYRVYTVERTILGPEVLGDERYAGGSAGMP